MIRPSNLLLLFLLFVLCACSNSASDNAEATTTAPENGLHYQTLTAGPLQMAIDPKMGARIASFTYEGKEILKTSRDKENMQWGSTAWTSPQSGWTSLTPGFDNVEYDFSITAENRMHFYSPIDPVSSLQVIKSIRLAVDEARGPLATVRYQVYNRGTVPVKIAAWENTRVPFAGETRFPLQGELNLGTEAGEPKIVEADSTRLLVFDKEQPNNQKIFCELPVPANRKYLFNTYENNDLLLIKSWKRPTTVAPGQSRLEISMSPEAGFAELGIQGTYKEIKPKEFVDLIVFWQLFPADQLERKLNRLR